MGHLFVTADQLLDEFIVGNKLAPLCILPAQVRDIIIRRKEFDLHRTPTWAKYRPMSVYK